jgi:hypothetical protein
MITICTNHASASGRFKNKLRWGAISFEKAFSIMLFYGVCFFFFFSSSSWLLTDKLEDDKKVCEIEDKQSLPIIRHATTIVDILL